MKINQKNTDGIEVFELEGEIDFHSSPQLRDKIAELVQKQTPKVMVKLQAVNYIDSSGLATFVEALQKIKKYNGKLVLSDMVPSVKSVFEIAKLDRVFLLAENEQEALGHFA